MLQTLNRNERFKAVLDWLYENGKVSDQRELSKVTGITETTISRTISVPASYIGTTGQLNCSFFGLSTKNEWTTDVTIEGRDTDGSIMAHAVIASAPFKANRATEYTGRLFSGEGSMSISLNDTWENSYTGTW